MIELKEVFKRFNVKGSEVIALNNVSLKVNRGDFVAIIGPKNSGKTTLINLLAGYLMPTRGLIIVDGKNLNDFGNLRILIYRIKNIKLLDKCYKRKNLYMMKEKKPRLILVDNIKCSKNILSELRELNSKGSTVIMVTEEPAEAAKANRVIKLIAGEIVSDIIRE